MAETPQEIAQDLAEAKQVLDYRPNLSVQKPQAIPGAPDVVQTAGQVPHVAQALSLQLLAAWHDLQRLKSWMADSLAAWEMALAPLTAPIAGDAVPADVLAAIQQVKGSEQLTFADLQYAFAHPEDPISSSVKKIWGKYQYGYEGSIAASLYPLLWRSAQYLPPLETNLRNLIALSTFGILGQSAPDPIAQLGEIASQDGHTLDVEQITGYQKLSLTISQQVSDLYTSSRSIVTALNSQGFAAPTGQELLTQLTGVLPHQGSNKDLNEIITALEMIRTLYTVYNDYQYFSLASLEARLDQLIEELLMKVLGEVANIFAHLESMLMTPVLRLIRKLDGAFGGASPKVMDDFADKLTILLNGVTSKFEATMLDMYRHSALHHNLTEQSTDKHAQNNSLRNVVKVIDLLIEALKALDGNVDWATVISNISQQAAQGVNLTLPQLPMQAQSSPPPDASLSTLATSAPGLNHTGSPSSIASGLLANIQSLHSGLDGGIS